MVPRWVKSTLRRLWLTFWLWLRPGVKWVLRQTTRLCELQRICYGTLSGAERSQKIGNVCFDCNIAS